MKLYHGTTERIAKLALTEGILTRNDSDHDGNWPKMDSSMFAVYMSLAYGPYFAVCATERSDDERCALIEIDTDLLNEFDLVPDEDAMEQGTRSGGDGARAIAEAFDDDTLLTGNMHERTAWIRDNLECFGEYWEWSINALGNCAYNGSIPPEAITRVTTFSPRHPLVFSVLDPCITVMNYRMCGDKYKALTRYFAGYEVTTDDIDENLKYMEKMMPKQAVGRREALEKVLADRSHVEVIYEGVQA